MTKKLQDVLIGRRIQINEGAPFAGENGVIERNVKGGLYEVKLANHEEPWQFALGDFTVLHDEVAAGAPSELVHADPYLVAFSLTNPRKRKGLDVESLSALASNIKALGLAQPILVRPLPGSRTADTFQDREEGRPLPQYELVCGERRLRASRLAGLEKIPMLVRGLDDQQALELQLVENIEREDLDPIEEAEGFELLRERLGYSVEQIAEHIAKGKGKDYVYKTLKLLALTPESRDAMSEGHLGRSTGLLVARYPAAQQADVVAFIKSQAVNGEPAPFREISPKVFMRFNLDLRKAVWPIADATLVEAAGACTACPKRTGAHGDLFGDEQDSPDSCTDPDCFESKRTAHVERVKADAAKQGLKVIDGDEAKAAFVSPHSPYMHGFVRLSDTAYTQKGDDDVERAVSFEDALRSMGKKAPKPRLIINPYTGEAVKVITDDLADKLRPEPEETPASRAWPFRKEADERPDDLRALDDYQVRRAVTLRMFDAVRNRDRADAEVLLMAKALFAISDWELPDTTTYMNWDADLEGVDYGELEEVVLAKLDALPPAEVAAVATMAAIETAIHTIGDGHAIVLQLAQAYGVDVLAIRDKVAEDLRRQEESADDEQEQDAGAEA
jgi:ParB/RepB/Spo0J family partition protein